jgi:hypothetical protein
MLNDTTKYLPATPGCPNYFNGYFTSMLGKFGKDPGARRFLYLFLCVGSRFGLYSLVYLFHTKDFMIYLVTAASALALIIQFATNDSASPQWWSSIFVLGMSLLVFIACLLVILKKLNSVWVPRLLYASLIGGMLQSLRVDFC